MPTTPIALAALSLALAATPAFAADTAAPQPTAKPVELSSKNTSQIAHSALLTVDGTTTADAVQISIHRVSDQSLINSDDVTIAVDGKNQVVTHAKNGSYEVPINDLRGDDTRDVDVTVGHDGIREILSGKVTVAEDTSAGNLFQNNKQIAWWILNIVIVLVAVMAFSRKKR